MPSSWLLDDGEVGEDGKGGEDGAPPPTLTLNLTPTPALTSTLTLILTSAGSSVALLEVTQAGIVSGDSSLTISLTHDRFRADRLAPGEVTFLSIYTEPPP